MADDPKPLGPRVVLDASALLVYLQRERGHLLVEPVLEAAVMSAVNLSEVLQKSAAAGVSTAGLQEDLQAVGCASRPSMQKTRRARLTCGPAPASWGSRSAIGPAWPWPSDFAFRLHSRSRLGRAGPAWCCCANRQVDTSVARELVRPRCRPAEIRPRRSRRSWRASLDPGALPSACLRYRSITRRLRIASRPSDWSATVDRPFQPFCMASCRSPHRAVFANAPGQAVDEEIGSTGFWAIVAGQADARAVGRIHEALVPEAVRALDGDQRLHLRLENPRRRWPDANRWQAGCREPAQELP